MSVLRSVILAIGLLTGLGGATIGSPALADETYSRTSRWIDGAAATIAFSPDGARMAFVLTDDRTVSIRDTATFEETGSFVVPASVKPGPDYVYIASFSPDGMRLVTSGMDGVARIWDWAAGREIAVLDHAHHPSVMVNSAAFSPDGVRLATASSDGTARIWDWAAGREAVVLRGHAELVADARFSPDGTRLVTASYDGTARIWDAASGLQQVILRHSSQVNSAAFSPDGSRVVTGARDGTAHVFDALGREILVLRGHEGEVLDAAFSPDGARIATGSDDDTARIRDAADGEEIAVLSGHISDVLRVAFDPDGERVFTVGQESQGIIWTRLEAASLPEGVAGLWFPDFGAPEELLPDDLAWLICVGSPIRISGDGLVAFFDLMNFDYAAGDGDPLQVSQHLRCATDLTCRVFPGPPAQGVEQYAAGALAFTGDAGEVCVEGECTTITRCPTPEWTQEERESGFAEAWEASVLAPGR